MSCPLHVFSSWKVDADEGLHLTTSNFKLICSSNKKESTVLSKGWRADIVTMEDQDSSSDSDSKLYDYHIQTTPDPAAIKVEFSVYRDTEFLRGDGRIWRITGNIDSTTCLHAHVFIGTHGLGRSLSMKWWNAPPGKKYGTWREPYLAKSDIWKSRLLRTQSRRDLVHFQIQSSVMAHLCTSIWSRYWVSAPKGSR